MSSRRLLVAVVLVAATFASILWDRYAATPQAPPPQTESQRPPDIAGDSGAAIPQQTPPPPVEPAQRAETTSDASATELASLIPDEEERAEVLETVRLIEAGGPYPHKRDGITFRNRERLLPARRGRYYREFTVRTPGRRDRGARRIVAGAEGEMYYTRDHYESFIRIDAPLEPGPPQ